MAYWISNSSFSLASDVKYAVKKDTQLFLGSDDLFYVNSYKYKTAQHRPLIIFKNGQQEKRLRGINNIQTMGGQLLFYDDRIAEYNKWAVNTVVVKIV